MRRLRTMDDIPLDGKRVLVRADFNVSSGPDGKIHDDEDYRLEAAIETIQELRRRRCKVIILPRRGRPEEDPEGADITPVWHRLQDLLREDIQLIHHLYGEPVEAAVQGMEQGSMLMLSNVREDPREKKENKKFAEQLAAVADVYVSESFSEVHRARTSLSLVPTLLPSCAGRRTVLEVEMLSRLSANAKRPYVAIVSGSKVTTKVALLQRLLTQVDTLCLGGKIANVFLAASGHWKDGNDQAEIEAAKQIMQEAGPKLLLPIDVIIGNDDGTDVREVSIQEIPEGTKAIWDIGHKSTQGIIKVCETAQTIMWNGPVGRFEVDAYGLATKAISQALAELSSYRLVGGGDTVNALEKYRLTKKYDHVSVGGGAMVAFLEGKVMPGLEPLYTDG
ncbi:MAG: phosphoglycerate kinase [Candidatus Andersenbacteria bacterium]|nr:phosphoglycerate kinase [Candidatus Andersenbacteria bacterium]MBI3251070.1 phosphoglycerate kinase [Candidatus Andersenbacteria bacterium]